VTYGEHTIYRTGLKTDAQRFVERTFVHNCAAFDQHAIEEVRVLEVAQ
jgi:hypothetical protein